MYGEEHEAVLAQVQAETMAMIRSGQMVPERIEPWWEERRENELTPDYLGRVLAEAGLPELAARARAAHFDDFFAPADVADGLELLHLVAELRLAAVCAVDPSGMPYSPATMERRREQIAVIENAIRRGEFDATKAESDRWAAGAAGQATMRELVQSAAKARPEFVEPAGGRNAPCPCGSGAKWKKCHGAG